MLYTFLLWPLVALWDAVTLLIALPCAVILLTVRAFDFTTLPGLFQFLDKVPCGVALQRLLIRLCSPYAATIRCEILQLTETSCFVRMDDWPWLRNPFRSVHAVAIGNLAELTSGLAMLSALEGTALRGIPTRIDCHYLRKARGRLLASCALESPLAPGTYKCSVRVLNAQMEKVCEASVEWCLKSMDD